MEIIYLLFALFTKHFVVDFLLQTEYQWKNKGTFLHPGGLLHAFLHGITTYFILLQFIDDSIMAYNYAFLEAIIHYLIDYSKMKINSVYSWTANENKEFWFLLGFDQYLHGLTYLLIAYSVVELINL